MNGFSTSRASGDLIWQITLCAVVAIVAIHWAVDLWHDLHQGPVDPDHRRGVETDRESAGDHEEDELMRWV